MEEAHVLKNLSKKSKAATGEILLKETHLSIRLRLQAGAMTLTLALDRLAAHRMKVDGTLRLPAGMIATIKEIIKPITSMETMMTEVTHLLSP